MPLVDQGEDKFTFRELISGSAMSSKYYEAENSTGFLMWIEMTAWGKRRCYPCLITGPEGSIDFFRIGNSPDSIESNRNFIARWEKTISPETADDFEIRELTEAEFKEKLKKLKN